MKLPTDPRILPDTTRLPQRLTDLHRDIARQVNGLSEGKLSAHYSAQTSAPTTGTHAQGDVIRNSNPTEQGTPPNTYVVFGWICTAGGTPGTWEALNVPTDAFTGGGGGGVSDGDKGDIVVSGSGAVWTIDPSVLTAFGRNLVGVTTRTGVLVGEGTAAPTAVPLTAGQVLIGTAGSPAAKTISGDATLASDGTLNIAAGAVGETELASSAVATTKIQTNAVTYEKIQNVTGSRLLGRSNSGTGYVEELLLGAGLSVSSTATVSVDFSGDELHVLKAGDTMTGKLKISADTSLGTGNASPFLELEPTDMTAAVSTRLRFRAFRYSGITAGDQVWEMNALGGVTATARAEFHIYGDPTWLKGASQADEMEILDSLRLLPAAPTTATASGLVGEIRVDDDYVYVMTSTGWKTLTLRPFKT